MVERDVEFIINNFKKPSTNILDAFLSNDIGSFNKILATSTYEEYKKLIESILSRIKTSLVEYNKQQSKSLIVIFLNVFYIFKKFDLRYSKSIFGRFIILSDDYNKKFLHSNEDLFQWKTLVDDYFSGDKSFLDLKQYENKEFLDTGKPYFEIFCPDYVNRKDLYSDFNLHKIFVKITKESYSTIRKTGEYESIYKSIGLLIDFFTDREYDSSYYNRILSLIVLKYGILFQFKKYTIDDIYEFKRYLDFIFHNNLYSSNKETTFKLIEGYGKAMFAAHLIGKHINLDMFSVYKKIVSNLYVFPQYKKQEYYSEFLVHLHVSSRTISLFEKKNSIYKYYAIFVVTTKWRQLKYPNYRGIKGFFMELGDFLFFNRFNFI